MNSERLCRGNMIPGVLGYGFSGVQLDIQNLAQYYADYLFANNVFGHSEDGFSPFARIDNDPVLGPCHEFLSRAENLSAHFSSGSVPLSIELSIYAWIYTDLNSAWGHREAVLLQDKDLTYQDPLYGFNDNEGLPALEGFIGLGFAEGPGYDPFGFGAIFGTVMVFNVFDPDSTVDCTWPQVTHPPSCENHGDVNGDGSISAGDAQLAFAIAIEAYVPTYFEACAADCNDDRSITAGDAQLIFGAIFGEFYCFIR